MRFTAHTVAYIKGGMQVLTNVRLSLQRFRVDQGRAVIKARHVQFGQGELLPTEQLSSVPRRLMPRLMAALRGLPGKVVSFPVIHESHGSGIRHSGNGPARVELTLQPFVLGQQGLIQGLYRFGTGVLHGRLHHPQGPTHFQYNPTRGTQ